MGDLVWVSQTFGDRIIFPDIQLIIGSVGSVVVFSSGAQRFQGMLPLEKNLRYVPLRCHFLHFEITVNGK